VLCCAVLCCESDGVLGMRNAECGLRAWGGVADWWVRKCGGWIGVGFSIALWEVGLEGK
jgi:hypothetical protein